MFIIGVLLLAVVFIFVVIGLEKGKRKNKDGISHSGTTRTPDIDKNSRPGQPV